MKTNLYKPFVLLILLVSMVIVIIVSCKDNADTRAFSKLFQDNKYSEVDVKTTTALNLYKINNKDELEVVKTIDKQTVITLLAENTHRINCEPLYLIKINSDKKIWSGWIKSNDLIGVDYNNLQYKLRHYGSINYWGFVITNDNSYICLNIDNDTTPISSQYIIYSRTGNKITSFSTDDLQVKYKDVCQGAFIGCSSDSKLIWFEGLCDYPICYGVINIDTQKKTLFSVPKKAVQQIRLNYNNGDMYYSDYPKIFETSQGIRLKKENKVYNLYKKNLYTDNEIIVDTNYGEGFDLQGISNNALVYQRSNEY